jgi:hypothetical protein
MSNYQDLACFIDVINYTMAFIIWRTTKNKLTKYFARKTHLLIDELSLRAIILRMWHLVDKLSK